MTEKRFTLTFDDKIIDNKTNSIHDVHSGYDVALDLSNLLNELHKENEQLKQQLWNITIDYYTETYSDNSIRRDEHINEFKKEFKAKYGDVE